MFTLFKHTYVHTLIGLSFIVIVNIKVPCESGVKAIIYEPSRLSETCLLNLIILTKTYILKKKTYLNWQQFGVIIFVFKLTFNSQTTMAKGSTVCIP